MINLRKVLLEEYTDRLLRALTEIDVFDDQGNIIISKDLKVRHKDSGYEYTVDDVVSDDDGVQVVLRDPEEPRVEPEGEEGIIMDGHLPDNHPRADMTPDDAEAEVDLEKEGEEETFYVIDKDEFEKQAGILKKEILNYGKEKKKFNDEIEKKKIKYTKKILDALDPIV